MRWVAGNLWSSGDWIGYRDRNYLLFEALVEEKYQGMNRGQDASIQLEMTMYYV